MSHTMRLRLVLLRRGKGKQSEAVPNYSEFNENHCDTVDAYR